MTMRLLLAFTTFFAAQVVHAGAVDCVIDPRQVIELRAPLEGLIDRVNVDRGDRVRAGQELVVLDTSVDRATAAIARQRSEMEGAIVSGKTRTEFSSRRLDRAQGLHAQNYLSAQARDEAATESKLAEASLRDALDNKATAELELKRQLEIIRLKTIRSPIAGVVLERLLHPGEFAEAGVGRKPVLRLAELDTLHVEAVLPAEAYGRLKPGMQIEVSPEIPAGARHVARIKVVDPVLDSASGTFGVRLELPNPGHKVPAGIRCTAEFPGVESGVMRRKVRHVVKP